MKVFERVRRYIRVSGVTPISRRYFIMNAFDGATTMLGIVVGAYVAGITDEFWIVWPGLGAILAMSLSGFVGAYMTEEAERAGEMRALEKSMLTDLKDTVVGRASRFASLWASLIDGLSPALAALSCLSPFFVSSINLFSTAFASQLSITISLIVMFLLGVLLGKISRRNVALQGLKMLVVGLIITLVFLGLKVAR
jgi:predicted membrane protein (TIGR00267 family)